nr:glycosyltransferase [uncultured Acetatifactor sp.]
MSKKILLTISLLISNRPATVRKCLDSIKPILEQVPSELILTDTGCGEQVRSIIEEYTDHIIDFEWCNDFSKARNAGLRQAKGKWFMFLDDDEWFEDVTEFIEFFNSGEYKKYGLGAYIQRNYLADGSNVFTDLPVGRMIRLEPDIKFVYSIHENFNRVPGEVKKFTAYVHHYGYAFKSREDARAHSMRNVSLLLKEHEKSPRNMKHTLQLAQEYNAIEQPEKSLEMSLDGISWFKKGKVEEDFCLNSLFSNEIDCYIQLKRYDDAIERGEKHLAEEKLDPLVRAVISGDLAIAYIEKNEYEKCMEHVRMYWDVWQKYQKNPDTYIEYVTIMTSECFEPRNRSVVLGNGVRAASRLGEAVTAWEWFQALEWQGNAIFISNEMIRAIVGRIPDAGAEERTYYIKMCSIIMRRKELEQYMVDTIREVCGWYGNNVKTIASFAGVESDHWFFKLAGIVNAAAETEEKESEQQKEDSAESAFEKERRYTPEEVEKLAGEVWEKMNQSMPLMKACDMLTAAEKLGVTRSRILEQIPFYIWNNEVLNFYGAGGSADIEWWNDQISGAMARDSLRMLVWRAYYSAHSTKKTAEIGIETGAGSVSGDENAIIEDIEDGLREYANCLTTLCDQLYRPETIEKMSDVLSVECQAAYRMKDMLDEIDAGRYDKAVEAIKAIRKLMPGLDSVMKRYLTWLNREMERQKQEARQAEGEFQILARQIKTKIRALIDAGQKEAALGVVNQLEALLPGDAEIQRWKEQLTAKPVL